MSSERLTRDPLPPRLSMDEYVDFVEAAVRLVDPVMAVQQKKIEERIRTPFCMSGNAVDRTESARPGRMVDATGELQPTISAVGQPAAGQGPCLQRPDLLQPPDPEPTLVTR